MLNIKEFNNKNVCKCGEKHYIETDRILWGSGTIKELLNLSKDILRAGHIALIIEKDSLDETDRKLILGLLNDKDYRITLYEQYASYELDKIELKEDVRLAISIGGESHMRQTRYYMAKMNIPFIFVPFKLGRDYMESYDYVLKDGVFKLNKTKAAAAFIVDTDIIVKYKDRNNIAYGFSVMMATRLYITEYYYNISRGRELCPYLFKQLKDLTQCNIGYKFYENEFILSLMENLLILSALKEMSNTKELDITELYDNIICISEKYNNCEYNYILSILVLSGYYKYRLKGDNIPLIIPKNRSYVIKKMSEELNIDYDKYMASLNEYNEEQFLYNEFILKEYAPTLIDHISDAESLAHGVLLYKRMLSDSGYFMKNMDISSALDLLPLVAELASEFTIFKLMYMEGYLNA